MKITLADHVIAEVVGDQLFLLDSREKQVYSLPAYAISDYRPETKTLLVTPEFTSKAQKLIDCGAASTPGIVSRRVVVGSTGALISGGLLAISMPAQATAASEPILFTGQWRLSSDSGGGDPFELRIVEFFLLFSLDEVTPLADADDSEPWTIQILGRTFTELFRAYYDQAGFLIKDGTDEPNDPLGDPGDPFYDFWFRLNQNLPGTREFVATITAGTVTVQILFQPTVAGS